MKLLMKTIIFYLLASVTFLLSVSANSKHESQEELYIEEEYKYVFSNPIDNPELPNILIIGDSISIGYTIPVRKKLKGMVDVYRIPENGKDSLYGLRHIRKWLSSKKFDIIHFNWGLWDICYRNPRSKEQGFKDKIHGRVTATPEQYKIRLEKIVTELKKFDYKLIWASTTPVPDNEIGRKKGDEEIYNAIASKIMKKNYIQTSDLYSFALKRLKDIQNEKGDVHFTSDGYAYLAEKVSESILISIQKFGK